MASEELKNGIVAYRCTWGRFDGLTVTAQVGQSPSQCETGVFSAGECQPTITTAEGRRFAIRDLGSLRVVPTRDDLTRAQAVFYAARETVETEPASGGPDGHPGIRSCGNGTPEQEEAFEAALRAYIRAKQARSAYVYGPALREHYSRD